MDPYLTRSVLVESSRPVPGAVRRLGRRVPLTRVPAPGDLGAAAPTGAVSPNGPPTPVPPSNRFVQPATVLAWQRTRFREHRARGSRTGWRSRPAINRKARGLIRAISKGESPIERATTRMSRGRCRPVLLSRHAWRSLQGRRPRSCVRLGVPAPVSGGLGWSWIQRGLGGVMGKVLSAWAASPCGVVGRNASPSLAIWSGEGNSLRQIGVIAGVCGLGDPNTSIEAHPCILDLLERAEDGRPFDVAPPKVPLSLSFRCRCRNFALWRMMVAAIPRSSIFIWYVLPVTVRDFVHRSDQSEPGPRRPC